MINNYSSGGLNVLDVQAFYCALKAKWIQKYLDFNSKGKWKLFKDFFLKRYNVNVLIKGNLNESDAASLDIGTSLPKNCLKFGHASAFKNSRQITFNLPIWYNSLIRIDNKRFFYKRLYKAGICLASHLLDENLQFLLRRNML